MKDAVGLQETYLPDLRIACSAEISISNQMNLGRKVEDEEWGCQVLCKCRCLRRRPCCRAAPRHTAVGSNTKFLSLCRTDPAISQPAGGGRYRDCCRQSLLHPCCATPLHAALPHGTPSFQRRGKPRRVDLINVLKSLWKELWEILGVYYSRDFFQTPGI